ERGCALITGTGNSLLSNTEDNDAWRGYRSAHTAVFTSGTLSGTSAGKEGRRRRGSEQTRRHPRSKTRSDCGASADYSGQTAALRRSKHGRCRGRPTGDHSWLFWALEPVRGQAEARASIRRSEIARANCNLAV